MRAAAWLLAGLVTTLGTGVVAHAASIKERTSYFAVRGSTLEELDADLQRAGPLVAATGARHPGATEVRFDGSVSYRETASTCRVGKTDLRLDLNMMLPRWKAPRRVDAETKLIWKTLEDDIRRHERQHSAIAKTWLKKMESAIRNLRPERDCTAMEARVNQVTKRYLAAHERAQLEFDAKEGRDVNRRLQRALVRNLEAMAAR